MGPGPARCFVPPGEGPARAARGGGSSPGAPCPDSRGPLPVDKAAARGAQPGPGDGSRPAPGGAEQEAAARFWF